MLDSFEIITTSGVVLWSKSYAPVGVNIINSLIKDVFIEENVASTATSSSAGDVPAARTPPYSKDKYTLKWTTAKDLGLIFVAVYQSLLHLSWIDKLLDNVKTLFTSLYRDQLKKTHSSRIDCDFEKYFDRQLEELEKTSGVTIQKADRPVASDISPPSSTGTDHLTKELPPPLPETLKVPPPKQIEEDTTSNEVTPIPTPDSSRPASPASHLITGKSGPGGRPSRRARKAAATSHPTSRDGPNAEKNKAAPKNTGKQMRKWDDSGMLDDGEDVVLDYSATTSGDVSEVDADGPQSKISQDSWAKRTGKGEVVLRDLDEEMDNILSTAREDQAPEASTGGIVNSGLSAISGMFRNVVGGKTLTEEDLAKPLKAMEEHLVRKNVARLAAVRLCDAVARDLTNTKTASFQSVDAIIRSSMEAALSKILTPSSSLDLLRSIQAHESAQTVATPPDRRPYVISIVGVNGVGKSTTLAKLAFLLLHNNYRVLVCGADTFRSGAVEQLRVHVRNLQSLTDSSSSPMGRIDIYERGYGKDPAHIARDAVALAHSRFDIVLIDTAGRRHNDSRLMSSLEGFARLARPDKIFMVGEALVGNDSVEQAQHFNASFGPGRGLDGFIVSKCDTVGEMVGTIVSMVHATGVPVVAVGVGQHYGDLRTLNVGWATRLLMM